MRTVDTVAVDRRGRTDRAPVALSTCLMTGAHSSRGAPMIAVVVPNSVRELHEPRPPREPTRRGAHDAVTLEMIEIERRRIRPRRSD